MKAGQPVIVTDVQYRVWAQSVDNLCKDESTSLAMWALYNVELLVSGERRITFRPWRRHAAK